MAYRVTLYKLGRAAARNALRLRSLKNLYDQADPFWLSFHRRTLSRQTMFTIGQARIAIDEAVKYDSMSRKDALDAFRDGYYEVGIPLNRFSRLYNDARDDALREGC